MGEAVDHSLSRLAPEDIRALVAYLRTVPAIVSPDLPATLAAAAMTRLSPEWELVTFARKRELHLTHKIYGFLQIAGALVVIGRN